MPRRATGSSFAFRDSAAMGKKDKQAENINSRLALVLANCELPASNGDRCHTHIKFVAFLENACHQHFSFDVLVYFLLICIVYNDNNNNNINNNNDNDNNIDNDNNNTNKKQETNKIIIIILIIIMIMIIIIIIIRRTTGPEAY